uniref:Uncharacterized protein n=1 Tax=Anguilla anguilla TaxID=7936 RepID=A0A0E9Q2Y3_ANGAN
MNSTAWLEYVFVTFF